MASQPTTLGRKPDDPLPPHVVAEFEDLMTRLDHHDMRPHEWARFRTILTIATLEAGDIEAGSEGYERAVALWRMSRHYDGQE